MRKDSQDEILPILRSSLPVREACERLGVHRTTLWRLRRKWERTRSVAHGLRGRRSNGAKDDSFRRLVCDLYARAYKPLGHSAHSFYDAVARGLPDYACYKTVLAWLREAGLVRIKVGEPDAENEIAISG